MLAVAGAMLLAAAVLVIRYGHVRYPYLGERTSLRHAGSRNKR